jgi:hypothetical protein
VGKNEALKLFKINFRCISNSLTASDNGLIDVTGNVKSIKCFSELPVKFGSVHGTFNIDGSQIKSLNGCPEYVSSDFSCRNNFLTNLIGGPNQVDGKYACLQNRLTSLEGGPARCSAFYCQDNCFTSLIGGPETVDTDYFCHMNDHIISLDGLPKHIANKFSISWTRGLPMLRLLTLDAKVVSFYNLPIGARGFRPAQMLDQYRALLTNINPDGSPASSKKELLWKFQQELIDNGFEDNARY